MGEYERSEWLKTLKVGDEVLVSSGRWGFTETIYTIEGETPKRWKVNGLQYRKDDGYVVGNMDRFFTARLFEVTQTVRDNIEKQELARKIWLRAQSTDVLYKHYSVEQLRAVWQLLDIKPQGSK